MPKNRFFVPERFSLRTVTLQNEESHHIKVMRLSKGHSLELVNGLGEFAVGTIISLGRNETVIEITAFTAATAPPYGPCLIQAFPKQNHLDTIIEKSVELGASKLWLFPGMRSEKLSLSDGGHKRLMAIAVSAMKQCGRLYLPVIEVFPGLLEWQSLPQHTFYGSFQTDIPKLQDVLQSTSTEAPPYLLMGPESGLAQEEITHLNTLGAQGVTLHPNILRTETAGPFAIGLCVHSKM